MRRWGFFAEALCEEEDGLGRQDPGLEQPSSHQPSSMAGVLRCLWQRRQRRDAASTLVSRHANYHHTTIKAD
jgi:hypothetical protein